MDHGDRDVTGDAANEALFQMGSIVWDDVPGFSVLYIATLG